jgi:small-conductance mechanosensitive channel
VITSIAGWFSIMLSNSIRLGQRVKIGDIKGDIIDISVIRTTIMEVGDWVDGDLYNGRITTISNSFMFKEALQNYSADYPFLWDEVRVPIRTESDFKLAREILHEVAMDVCGEFAQESQRIWNKMKGKYRIEDAQVMPTVSMSFDENWITFTIRYVVDYKRRRSTKDKIYTRLLEEIRKHDDVIMIATASLEVTNLEIKDMGHPNEESK